MKNIQLSQSLGGGGLGACSPRKCRCLESHLVVSQTHVTIEPKAINY